MDEHLIGWAAQLMDLKWWRNDVCMKQWEVLSDILKDKAKHAEEQAGRRNTPLSSLVSTSNQMNSNSRNEVLTHSQTTLSQFLNKPNEFT